MQALAQHRLICATLTQGPCSGHRTQVGPRFTGTEASQAGSLPRDQPLPKEDGLTGAQTELQGGWNFVLNVELQ